MIIYFLGVDMELRTADAGDRQAILELYSSAVGTAGCTWDEDYPSDVFIDADISSGGLYVYTDNEKIIGAVSIVPERELDELPEWTVCDGSYCEIARVVISNEYRGRRLGFDMLSRLLDLLREQGMNSVHILVAKNNAPAIALYKRLGFEFYYEHFMFGHDYLSAELLLK